MAKLTSAGVKLTEKQLEALEKAQTKYSSSDAIPSPESAPSPEVDPSSDPDSES